MVSGVWYFGYGPVAGEAKEKALPAGSFYTEPGGVAPFAETRSDPVLVYITGVGPTDTVSETYEGVTGGSVAQPKCNEVSPAAT